MDKEIKKIRRWIIFFIISLAASGITAIPAETELSFLTSHISKEGNTGKWLETVYLAIQDTNRQYPFVAYGYDWLAFAHIILAILFIGPLRDPIKNRWVIEFGMIACVLIIPFAMMAGYFREIPVTWRLIDCCFGVIGMFPLLIVYKTIRQLETSLKTKSYVE